MRTALRLSERSDHPPAAVVEEREKNPSPLRRALVPTVLIGIGLVTALALLGDARDLGGALRRFNWWLIVPILALTIWNYCWRFLKWHMYLRVLGIAVPADLSSRIFLSGFAMSLTPGKIGEVVKAVYVRRTTGEPVNRTSAIVAAERITDALAMLLLAAVGATQYAYGRPMLAIVAVFGVFGILLLQRPRLLTRLLERAEALPLVGPTVTHAAAFVDASGELFRPPVLLKAVGLGVVSWSGECVAFFLVLLGLGVQPTPRLLLAATFILAISSLAGGASMLPGGLGVADAGIAGLLVLLIKDDEMSRSVAAGATLMIRFATLWFAVIIGALALAQLERRWGRVETTAQPLQSPEQNQSGDTPEVVRTARDGGNP